MRFPKMLAILFLAALPTVSFACGGGFGCAGPLWGPATSFLFSLDRAIAPAFGLLLALGVLAGPIGRTPASWSFARAARVGAALLALFTFAMSIGMSAVQIAYPMYPMPNTSEAIDARNAAWAVADRAIDLFPWIVLPACATLIAWSRLVPTCPVSRALRRSRGVWLCALGAFVLMLGAGGVQAAAWIVWSIVAFFSIWQIRKLAGRG